MKRFYFVRHGETILNGIVSFGDNPASIFIANPQNNVGTAYTCWSSSAGLTEASSCGTISIEAMRSDLDSAIAMIKDLSQQIEALKTTATKEQE